MKHTLLILLYLILLLTIGGLVILTPDWILLAVPLLVYFMASILNQPKPVKLQVDREITPKRVRPNIPVRVVVTIENQGEQITDFSAQELLPRGVQVKEGATNLLAFLPANGKLQLDYLFEAPRGEYRRFLLKTEVQESFDGFEIQADVEERSPILVYPETEPLTEIKIRPPHTRGFAGIILARRGGSGVNFFSIREYQPGDPLRQINWKVSSRGQQALYTNIFEQEQVADVGIILDARQSLNLTKITKNAQGYRVKESLFEHSVQGAAALSKRFIEDGHRVSLLVYGSGKKRVFPGYGKIQQRRILDALSSVKPVINFALTNFDNLPVRFFPPKSQIVLISPLLIEDVKFIRKMCIRGYSVLIISPNPIAFKSIETNDFDSLAYRLAMAERTFVLRQVHQIGAQVVDWHVHESLEQVLCRASFRLQTSIQRRRVWK
ncbi:MAG: DUF58 domain-containing protein [Anaerolineaceae bacterium]|nr:DUF58 domain-containing protein [Anaerolineaceae bacterium]